MLEKKTIYTDRLMRPIAHFSHGSRVGGIVLIGAVAGVFPDLRLAGDSIGRLDVVAQAKRMFENLETSLELLGASLSDVVRVKTYLAFPRETQKYLEVFEGCFRRTRPVHTIVGSWDFPLPQAAIELDAVAIVNGKARPLYAAGSCEGHVSGVLCDNTLYATALPIVADGCVASSEHRQVLAAQADIARLLSAAELRSADICYLHVTLADMRDLPVLEHEMRAFFGGSIPAMTVVGAPLEKPEYRIAIEVVAIKGGGHIVSSELAPSVPGRPAPGILAGDLLFLSGQTGLSQTQEDAGNVEHQTRLAWDRLRSLIAAAGLTPDAVIRTNNILTDWRDYAGFNAGYGANMREPYVPRATVLGHLSDARARVQIEGIAHRKGAGATILQVAPDASA